MRAEKPPLALQAPPRLLTVLQVAAYIGFSVRTVLRMVEHQRLPQPVRPLGPGTDPRWDVREIDRWIDALVEEKRARSERVDRLMGRSRAGY